MTSYVTALHILSFAALRLISIRYPHTYSKINRFHEKVKHKKSLVVAEL